MLSHLTQNEVNLTYKNENECKELKLQSYSPTGFLMTIIEQLL